MGVKLTSLIQKRGIELGNLYQRRITIDFSNMAFQFLSSIRQPDGTLLMDSKGRITSVYMGILTRITNLMSRNISVCFVFDGKAPLLKLKTQEERAHRKTIAEERYALAKEEENIPMMARYAKQTARLSYDIIDGSKELFKALGLPAIQSPQEADAQMSFMCERGDVWAVASSDQDCLLYGAPRLVTNLTVSQRRRLQSGSYVKITPQLIELEPTLKNLGINSDQLIALAILIGTDYNNGIKGVGPKTALKLVKQHRDFNKVFKEAGADFNWKEVYALFKSMPIVKNYKLKWSGIDVEKVKKILVDEHDFLEERVDKALSKVVKSGKEKNQFTLGDF